MWAWIRKIAAQKPSRDVIKTLCSNSSNVELMRIRLTGTPDNMHAPHALLEKDTMAAYLSSLYESRSSMLSTAGLQESDIVDKRICF